MSIASAKKLKDSNSSLRRISTKDSLQSKKSRCSGSITSVHGSKFGRSVLKFPKQNDPSLVHSISVVNSRVIRTLINFPININAKLPNLMYTEATDCIRELGNFFDILDYEFNYATFWLLDILSKIIKHMQLKKFSGYSQNVTLTWFRYVLRLISINGTSREEIFSHLKEMFLKAEEYIKTGKSIPHPEDINLEDRKLSKHSSKDLGSLHSFKSLPSISSRQSRKTNSQKSLKFSRQPSLVSNTSKRTRSSKSSKSNRKPSSTEEIEENLQNLKSIIEIIYEVFADRFMFSLISEAYCSPTIIAPMDIPLDFKEPKQLRPTLVLTPPVSPKSKKPSVTKSGKKGKDKGKGKGKRKSSPTPKDETEVGDKNEDDAKKKSKNEKSKEKGKKGGGKEGKGKNKSQPRLSPRETAQEETNETKNKTKEKGKEKGGKSKGKKSKSSDEVDIKNKKDSINSKNKMKKVEKSHSLKDINEVNLEEKLKLFERPISPEMKLEMKKVEVKDKYILPLSEGVGKDYVENLIKSLLPPEVKPTENVLQEKSEQKSKKSSSLKSKKENSLKGDKKDKKKKKK